MTDSAAVQAHEWVAPYSAASDLCGAMVMRNGGGDECGLPRDHKVHRPATPRIREGAKRLTDKWVKR